MHKLELELDKGAYAHLMLLSVERGEGPTAQIKEIVAQWVSGDIASRTATVLRRRALDRAIWPTDRGDAMEQGSRPEPTAPPPPRAALWVSRYDRLPVADTIMYAERDRILLRPAELGYDGAYNLALHLYTHYGVPMPYESAHTDGDDLADC